MNTEQTHNDVEYQIFACILLKPDLLNEIDLNEKYFKNSKILAWLKNLYKRYGYLDSQLIASSTSNSDKAINFVVECMEYEVSCNNIFGYYKKIKSDYYKQKINLYFNKMMEDAIDYKTFCDEMNIIGTDDNDSSNLLTTNDIKINLRTEREYTNIFELDYLLKGIEYGKLSLWSGITNHGKTTLMIQFAKECLKQHKKIFYFSGEQTSSEFKNYLYVGMCTKPQLEFITDEHNNKIYDVKPKDEVIDYYDDIYKNDLFLYDNETTNNTITNMIKTMEYAHKQGVRIFFIDNFMQLDNSERLEEQTKIVEMFKRFARDKNVIINLVAHPRKTQFMKCRLTIFDIAGTQNIANKSANICSIIRTDILPSSEREEVEKALFSSGYNIEKCDGIVEVIKTKGNSCKMVGLTYDMDTKTYKQAPKLTEHEKTYLENKFSKKCGR